MTTKTYHVPRPAARRRAPEIDHADIANPRASMLCPNCGRPVRIVDGLIETHRRRYASYLFCDASGLRP